MINPDIIKKDIENLRSHLPTDVFIVAASKTRTVEDIKTAIGSGISIIAENYVSEAKKKYKNLKDYFKNTKTEFHLIGPLQSNKTKIAVEIFDMIQSVDRIKIINTIDKEAKKIKKIIPILIQINIGNEPQKSGCDIKDLPDLIDTASSLQNVKLVGFMCIPPAGKDPTPYFKKMEELKRSYDVKILSMGMSDDYEKAIEYGSNMIRLGAVIFGPRE